ncbi:unnamed protein product [Amoebophrya sp. A120]|nr:unnamed protein product [Amoebophrya sp. A120]|eukprot:GSA120T00005903001.1
MSSRTCCTGGLFCAPDDLEEEHTPANFSYASGKRRNAAAAREKLINYNAPASMQSSGQHDDAQTFGSSASTSTCERNEVDSSPTRRKKKTNNPAQENKTLPAPYNAIPPTSSGIFADRMYEMVIRSSQTGGHGTTTAGPDGKMKITSHLTRSYISSVHPSEFENLLEERAVLEVPILRGNESLFRKRGVVANTMASRTGSGSSSTRDHFKLTLPKIVSVDARTDPTVFYRVPLGFGLWDAAVALMFALGTEENCQDLFRRVDVQKILDSRPDHRPVNPKNFIQHCRVLELGCGAAPLPSMICAEKWEPAEVVCTDFLPALLDWAQENVNANFQQNLQQIHSNREDPGTSSSPLLRAEPLPWGSGPDMDRLLQGGHKFDLILGADILAGDHAGEAEHRHCLQLLATTIDYMTDVGAVLVLSHSTRQQHVEEWVVNSVLGEKWDLLAEKNDDMQARWRQYGKLAHNSDFRTNPELKILMLQKRVR